MRRQAKASRPISLLVVISRRPVGAPANFFILFFREIFFGIRRARLMGRKICRRWTGKFCTYERRGLCADRPIRGCAISLLVVISRRPVGAPANFFSEKIYSGF